MSGSGSQNLNSKHAWRELGRQGLPERPAGERAADFLEIYGLYDEATAREQASRCIQCPDPSCVSGCPLCNPIPQWLQLTAEGRFLEAAAVLNSATNMAEICARLCPSDHLCEGACLLNSKSDPVPIQALEQFLLEYAFAHGQVDAATAPPNGRKVAVVGSGPTGLVCAEELATQGFGVTVFDSTMVPGGLLVNSMPAFKLDQSLLQRRLELLKRRGIVFRLGVKLWEGAGAGGEGINSEEGKARRVEQITIGQLRAEYDAVFLGLDSRKARPLEIAGADLCGVVPALPFLWQKLTPMSLGLPPMVVAGKRVVVLGGGDTAMDCLRAAIRYGAREAICAYRREEADMPCGRREYRNAVEEGAQFVFCAAPVAVLGDGQGQVTGLRFVRTKLGAADGDGPRPFLVQPRTEFELGADWVVAALGFEPLPCPPTEDFSGLARNAWGGLAVDKRQMTSLPGVFAGGDLVRGPGNLLEAVREGRRAGEQIGIFLSDRSD